MATSVWRGYISFGLISIPVRLFRAARPERVSLRKLYRPAAAERQGSAQAADDGEDAPDESAPFAPEADEPPPSRFTPASQSAKQPAAQPSAPLTPVQQANVLKGSGEAVPKGAVVKGYEYEKDRFVAIEADELKGLSVKTATTMEIGEFVELSEIDPVYFETSYYVTPDTAGQKAYALLYQALQSTGLVAVAQIAMHSREHVVIVRPAKKGMIAHTMFFNTEVRADQEYAADTNSISSKELALAKTLIESLKAPFEPEKYRDTYREKLEALIAAKVAGQPIAQPEKPSRSAAVIDIAEALQKSLAALKKPAASSEQSAGHKTKKTSG